ncbi:MAG: hypothetical protein K0Q52_98 [Microbacterium sp.]|jgi:hypothetical protein|nr:hypothetical protein [Microbacterium sp.]
MENLLEQYKNQFTLDGKLKPQPGVTKEKVKEAKRLFTGAQAGSYVAEGQLKELFSSTDLSFSMAHLLNIDLIPQLPKEAEQVENLAGYRLVKDFNPVVLRSIIGRDGVEGAGVDSRGAAAVVPEGTPYPIVTVKSDEESFYSKLSKRGFAFDLTFEAIINDLIGELEGLPTEFLKTTGKTYYAEVFDALEKAGQFLESVTLPNGESTVPNAPVSAAAIIAAAVAYENRAINGNKLGAASSYNVIVPKGRKRFLDYDILQYGRIIQVQDGNLTLAPDSAIQALFPSIEIIESDRVTGSEWYFYPKPGSTSRPVLERLGLRGYETPEIRVRNDQGFYPGGGQVGMWQGGFVADTASYRYRLITGAVLWDDTFVVRSKGTGQA